VELKESVTHLDAATAPAVASQDPPSDQVAAAFIVTVIIVGIVAVDVWPEESETASTESASTETKSARVKAASVEAAAPGVKTASSPVEAATSMPAASAASECDAR
jgi:hypothetical protein